MNLRISFSFRRCMVMSLLAGYAMHTAMAQETPAMIPLTLEEASRRMLRANRTLQIASQTVAMAESEYRKTAGTWWPSLQAEGAYVAMSNDIGVRFTLLEHTFSFPIIRQHLSDISLSLTLPLFTGGQRWWGTKMARQGIQLARLRQTEVQSSLQTTLVASYYALALTRRVAEVHRQSLDALERHYLEASQLEQQGMLTPSERLYARLCRDEAQRTWESSVRESEVAAQALCVLLGEAESTSLCPVTPFFVADESAADLLWLNEMEANNTSLQMIDLQAQMAKNRLKMARGDYLPSIFAIGRQSVYAYHLPKNLLPHTMLGVGFTWNLFDGMRREATVRQSKLALQTLAFTHGQTKDDLQVAQDKLLGSLKDAQANLRSLHTAVTLNEEHCRMRRQSFAEGMATSVEVTDAEVMLAKTQMARLAAAYEYVVTLASLCTLAGCPERFWNILNTSIPVYE